MAHAITPSGHPRPEPDASAALRSVTVAVGVTAVAWHGVNATAIPFEATAVLLGAIGVLGAHVAWLWWLVRHPSRACLGVGAVALAAGLAGTAVVLLGQSADGAGVGFASFVGVAVQATLLVLALAGLARTAPPRLHGFASGVGLAVAALTLCVTVAGGSHEHRSPSVSFAPASTSDLLCHLV